MDRIPPDAGAFSAGAPRVSPKTPPRSSSNPVGQRAFAARRDGDSLLAAAATEHPDCKTEGSIRASVLRRLAAQVRSIEGRGADARGRQARGDIAKTAWTLGVAAVDNRLEPCGLALGALHEIKPAMTGVHGVRGGDWASAFTASVAFALALCLRRRIGQTEAAGRGRPASGTILWCWPVAMAHEIGGLHAPGLTDLGLDPAALIVAEPDKAAEVLWAMEEGLKAPGLALVVGVLREAGLTPARRLALAAATHGTPCLLVTDPRTPVTGATATRWRIGRAVSAPHPFANRLEDALPGAPRYRVALERSRAAGLAPPVSPLILEWSHATQCFSLVSPSADPAIAEDRARRHRR